MFFVSNLLSSSQAGRRGFEPRLPLQESTTYRQTKTLYSFVLHSHKEVRFELFDSLLSPLYGCAGVNVLIHIQRVAELIGYQFWVDLQLAH